MNSRSVSDNLVNFSTDLATTLSQLDSKEPLLSFPFDHLYACSDSGDRQTLHLKEVEISSHCVVPHQEKHVTQRLASLESQNKKLKDLLIYHLDLIQQQNVLMSKREKAFQALRQENDTLKSKVLRAGVERKVVLEHHGVIPPPLHVPVTATVTSSPITVVPSSLKTVVPSSTSQQNFFNSFNELLLVDDHTAGSNAYIYNPSTAPKPLDPFGIERPSDTVADLHSFLSSELGVPSILEVTSLANEVPPQPVVMVDNKRTKKEPKNLEANNEPKYTVTTKSGNPKISRNRKRPTGIGSFSRMSKTKTTTPKQDKSSTLDDGVFSNKQSKMTYGKAKQSKYGYTALQERLQLIEPTPTGEDPYQIGEAEMREQSPIPKLMLQKTNHGRIRVRSESCSGVTSTITSTTPTRRIYDTMSTSSSKPKIAKLKSEVPNIVTIQIKKDADNSLEDDQEVDVEKSDSEIDWRIYPTTKPKETSVCDFSYGETSTNLVNIPLDITKLEFPDFFEPGPVKPDSSSVPDIETAPEVPVTEKTKKRRARTTSLAGPLEEETSAESKRAADAKRGGRKRANSTAASIKRGDNTQQKVPTKPRARRATRAKKIPVPGMTTKKLYHTCLGDPDLSWYLGLDPDIKKEDCDTTENNTASNVEVPRWREKLYTPLYSLEGTENLDDKVFEKRHQKLEAEERRQLRWHMRRMREQRHVEKLRQRHRDTWGSNSVQAQTRGEHTIWPQPVRDLQYIEITDTLPVTAFGEEVPDLPAENFMLPWVRVSKALKRSKRSKTLH